VARIRAVLRRAQPGRPPLAATRRLTSGPLQFDRVARRAWLAGDELHLTPKALALLEYLLTHPDELLTRDRPGIPPDELDEVWEELSRGQAARGVPGTGLGLPLVRTIVARHGGEERIRSRVGQGTVVSLRLPALEPSRDRHAP
jgi:hypothetical protein